MARSKRTLPQETGRKAFDQASEERRNRGGIYDQAQETTGRSGEYRSFESAPRRTDTEYRSRSAVQGYGSGGPDILAHSTRRSAAAQPHEGGGAPSAAANGKKGTPVQTKSRIRQPQPSRAAEHPAYTAAQPVADDLPLPTTLRERGQAARLRARRRRAAFVGALILLLVGIWVLIAFVFKIGELRVSGSSIYNETVILEKFGYREGDNLFTFNKRKAEQEIAAALPYLETVKIVRRLPDTVTVEVTGSVEKYCFVQQDGSTVITTPSLKVLRLGSNAGDLLEIRGVAFAAPVPGQQLLADETESLQAVNDVLTALDTGIIKHYSALDMSDPYNISFKCEDRFIVKLGTTVELEYKLQMAAKAIAALEADATGVIDASSAWTSRSAYYRPQAVD